MIYNGCWVIVKRKEKMLKKISNYLLKVKRLMFKINIIFKMTYERSKTNQISYYPELKL